jgi:iron complex outermembrane receptor protein
MHIITRSPFESEGTSISVGGGGRDFVNFARTDPNGGRNIYMASARHARRFSDKVGFKISAQYYQGRDWESYLPVDVAPRKIQFGKQTATGRIAQGDSVINQGDFNVEKIAGEARLDFRLSDDATLIFNGGYNQADQIELTGIGAGQAKDWKYIYGQARFNYKNLFVQGFINASDAGDTYILRTGDLIVDNSKLYVGQAQHSLSLGERQRFTYGVDAIFTRPNTKNTIHGRNEGKNQIDELGAYLQSETKVFSKLDLVAAARVDDHNHIKDPVFSPRAALVFKPSTDHTFRLTYNRAFSTPTSNNLFLDLRQENRSNPFFPLNQPIPTLNLNPNIVVIQARGVPSSTGFTFRHGLDGRAQMYSQFDQIDGYADATLNNVWTKLRTILVASNPALGSVLPPTLTRTIPLVFLNPATGQPVTEVKNVESIEPTIHNNFEIGYRGIISNKLLFTVDVYRAHIENFVSDIGSINYTTHAVRPVAGALLIEEMVDRGIPRPVAEGVVNQLFDPASPNNLARAPLGVITPEQVLSDVEITASYRNFGNIWLTGSDLSFTYYATQNWNFSGNYSYVNHDIFRNVDGIQDVALNAPQHKAGLSIQYRAPKRGYEAELRSRYIEGFPMDSGDYRGEVQTYTLVDFNFGYDLPFSSGTRLSLNVQNIFDNRHREFIGAPILGRLIMTRLTQTF